MSRTVIFAEVPAFYVSVERADDPTLNGRPVIVGGDPRKRGLVQSASAEALAAGVRVGMPMLEALQICPRARTRLTDMPRYNEVSRRLLACLRRLGGELEPFGKASGYFDGSREGSDPDALADRLRAEVDEGLSLPLRVGIAPGKFLARLAAEEAGDAGVLRVPIGGEAAFLAPLPVTRLDGVGEKTAANLAALGARCIGDVVALGREQIESALGTHGGRIFSYATGADDAPVRATKHPQSISRESKVGEESVDLAVLGEQLQGLAVHLEGELRLQGLACRRITLKIRYADQARTSRSKTLDAPAQEARAIGGVAVRLLADTQAGSRPVRSLGIQLGRLSPVDQPPDPQLDLFTPDA